MLGGFKDEGYAVLDRFLSDGEIETLAAQACKASRARVGTRRLLDQSWCQRLSDRVLAMLKNDLPTLGPLLAVECTLFVKTPEANWSVSLHQDLSIPVAQHIDSDACSGWAIKQGRCFVQPPDQILADLLAVRLHFDQCDETNGALQVVPGSHRLGRLTAKQIQDRPETRISVPVGSGGLMLMRPLLLHASRKVTSSRSRRVLHFVFGPPQLPLGLRWSERTEARPGEGFADASVG